MALGKFKIVMLMFVTALFTQLSVAQDGNLVKPVDGQSAKTILAEIQSRVDKVQTLTATLEFDEKDDDADKKKKKKKKKKKAEGVNPAWPEPPGRDIERGPMQIKRGVGAYLMQERKKEKAIYVANSSSIWKYEVDEKEARHIPANWPVVDTFVSNALKMNVMVSMEGDTIKYLGTESVGGVPCWVLEGKSPSRLGLVGVEQTKLKMWIGQPDGIPRIIKVPGESDAIIRLKNVQINVPVDESKFKFTPPAGVKTKNILGF